MPQPFSHRLFSLNTVQDKDVDVSSLHIFARPLVAPELTDSGPKDVLWQVDVWVCVAEFVFVDVIVDAGEYDAFAVGFVGGVVGVFVGGAAVGDDFAAGAGLEVGGCAAVAAAVWEGGG